MTILIFGTFLLLLTSSGLASTPARAPATSPAPTTAPAPRFLGEWFDIKGNSYTLSESDPGSFLLLTTGRRPGPFSGVDLPGNLKDGQFTCIHRPEQMQNAEIPSTVATVDTRLPGVLIVVSASQYQWTGGSDHALFSPQRRELTRDKDLLTRPPRPLAQDRAQLAADLRNPAWTVRREAIRTLAADQPEGTAINLLAALGDEFYTNKLLAIRGLAKLKDPTPEFPALISCLLSGQWSLVDAASAALSQLGPRIAPDLLPFLEEHPKLDNAWMTPLNSDLKPELEGSSGYHVAFRLRNVFATWNAADLQPLARLVAQQSFNVRSRFISLIAPQLKPSGPATDFLVAFIDARRSFQTPNDKDSSIENAILAIGTLADPRLPEVLSKLESALGREKYPDAFRQARGYFEMARKNAATASAPAH